MKLILIYQNFDTPIFIIVQYVKAIKNIIKKIQEIRVKSKIADI